MKIGSVEIGDGLLGAPLAGVSDVGFRRMCKIGGASLTYTEMVSAKGLLQNSENTKALLATDVLETPVAVQIFGANAFDMAEAARHPALSKFDIIDINMGCPVPKVNKNGGGSALMRTPERASTIIRACVAATGKPVTVKIRLGIDDASKNYLDFGKMCEDCGAAAVTLHARTKAQLYGGRADWGAIALLRQTLHIPVIANGDVVDRESYLACKKETGCEAVMIGRGAFGNPYVFSDCRGEKPSYSKRELVLEQIKTLGEHFSERYILNVMRRHIGWYLKNERGARETRAAVNTSQTMLELLDAVDAVFPSGG